jgi:hypothetical protein
VLELGKNGPLGRIGHSTGHSETAHFRSKSSCFYKHFG